MNYEELTYWMALAHLPKLRTSKKNEIIIKFVDNGITISDFFELDIDEWHDKYGLNESEIELLTTAYQELPNYSTLLENLVNEGFELIPITSKKYSKTLKENLKKSSTPTLLYTKGNLELLHEKSIAVVGSRNASDISLEFTDNIVDKSSKEFKVIVSGFAKGVDRKALDSAIEHIGQSIIVLPQGIQTFSSGIKKYYKQITEGNVLVLSTFHPNAPWNVARAMERNNYIYGLASEIYVAESSDKGGTWSGVINGLRKNRDIYVRKPEKDERNANNLLIEKGATPVDFEGNILKTDDSSKTEGEQLSLL